MSGFDWTAFSIIFLSCHLLGMKSKADPSRPGPPTASRHISYVRRSLGTNFNAYPFCNTANLHIPSFFKYLGTYSSARPSNIIAFKHNSLVLNFLGIWIIFRPYTLIDSVYNS